jgi:molecular chaperone GrpE
MKKYKKSTARRKEDEAVKVEDETTPGPAAGDAVGNVEVGPAGEQPASAAGEREEDVQLLKDRLLRLQADFENFRKRTLREKNELYGRANEDLMLELLAVLDHLDLALVAVNDGEDQSPVAEGFKLVSDQLLAALARFGLVPIDAVGRDFDPNFHEAVSHVPSGEFKDNVVTAEIRKGYMLKGRLLRASRVVVSSGLQVLEDGLEERPSEGRQ